MIDAAPHRFTAFIAHQRLASGPLAEVALAVLKAPKGLGAEPIIIFDDATGLPIDLDLRGTERDIGARLPPPASNAETPAEDLSAPEPRGRGRPKLGVVAREVTLLPRHWDWLGAQPGGASVALRKLVDAARVTHAGADRRRLAQQSADRFMSALAGNEPGYEEAARALYAGDRTRFAQSMVAWPVDVRDHAMRLATAAFDDDAA